MAKQMNLSANPISNKDDDLIGVAKQLNYIRKIIGASQEQSLRVGLFGEWGSGKTSIVKILESELEKENVSFFWFNPWRYSSKDSLINGFNLELFLKFYDYDKASGVFKNRKLKSLIEMANHRDPSKIVNYVGSSSKMKLFGDIIYSFLFNQTVIGDIVNNKENKIVVAIEDLDRCDPEILKPFLLYIREVLDKKNIITILIADYEKLSKDLSGNDTKFSFFEKIYDIPIFLNYSYRNIVPSFLAAYKDNPFSKEIISKYINFIPSNPRFLKKLCKQLSILKPEVDRYYPNECNRESLFLVQLLKFRFPIATDLLFTNDTFLSEILLLRDKTAIKKPPQEEQLDKLLQENLFSKTSLSDKDKNSFMNILLALTKDYYVFYSENPLKYCYFLEQPISLTQKEIEGLLNKSTANLKLEDLSKLIKEKSFSLSDVSKTIEDARTQRIYKLCNESLIEESLSAIDELNRLSSLLLEYIKSNKSKDIINIDIFEKFLSNGKSLDNIYKTTDDRISDQLNKIIKDHKEILSIAFEIYSDVPFYIYRVQDYYSFTDRSVKRELIDDSIEKHVENLLESSYEYAEDTFIKKVLASDCNLLRDQMFLSMYSRLLKKNILNKIIEIIKGLEDEQKSITAFNFFDIIWSNHRIHNIIALYTEERDPEDINKAISELREASLPLFDEINTKYLSLFAISKLDRIRTTFSNKNKN